MGNPETNTTIRKINLTLARQERNKAFKEKYGWDVPDDPNRINSRPVDYSLYRKKPPFHKEKPLRHTVLHNNEAGDRSVMREGFDDLKKYEAEAHELFHSVACWRVGDSVTCCPVTFFPLDKLMDKIWNKRIAAGPDFDEQARILLGWSAPRLPQEKQR